MDLDRLEDYKEAVIQAYKMKITDRTLPPYLADPTTANLKSECIAVFHKRYTPRDSETFKALFEERSTAAEYYKVLTISKADKFKPLSIFLKKKNANGNTHPRYIEMLAFLIDFELRPHRPGDMVKIIERETIKGDPFNKTDPTDMGPLEFVSGKMESQESTKIESVSETVIFDPESISVTEENQQTDTTIDGTNIPTNFRKTLWAFLATLLVVCGAYIYYISSRHQCMYWNTDHYEAIDCAQKGVGPTPIAFDEFTLEHQHRINDLNSITEKDINQVYYSKENGNVLFYKIGGDNPEDHRKRLLPMSEHIYIKYVKNH